MKWNYTLRTGSVLRDTINGGNPVDVIGALYDCYAEMRDAGLIDADDFDRFTEDFDLYDLDDDEEAEDAVDYELENFYDLCDSARVWVAL